jgi:Fe-S-cluster containining protein
MSRHEIKAIKQYVKKNKIDPEPISDTLNLSCPFRDDQAKKCKIYEVRPWICRRFMCNDKTPHTGTTKKLQVVNVREEFFGGKPWPWMKID